MVEFLVNNESKTRYKEVIGLLSRYFVKGIEVTTKIPVRVGPERNFSKGLVNTKQAFYRLGQDIKL
jgi:hypothetical protein